MVERIREMLQTTGGKIVAVVLMVIAAGAIYYSVQANLGDTVAAELSSKRMFIDATTGKTFRYEIERGETIPVEAPSGQKSGYLAEACFWTKDGKPKTEPTWVLLNEYAKKSGPTFCPDCGRLVVGLNPPPNQHDKPPPTQAEYASRPREQ